MWKHKTEIANKESNSSAFYLFFLPHKALKRHRLIYSFAISFSWLNVPISGYANFSLFVFFNADLSVRNCLKIVEWKLSRINTTFHVIRGMYVRLQPVINQVLVDNVKKVIKLTMNATLINMWFHYVKQQARSFNFYWTCSVKVYFFSQK